MEDFVGNPGLEEIGQRIFSYLDNRSLCQSRSVCKLWRDFITKSGGSRIYWIRILEKLSQKSSHWIQANKDWKRIMKDVYYKCDKETIRKFVEIYEKYFPTIPAYVPTGRGLNQGASPLHLAVYAGDFRAVRILVDLFRYKSLECITDSTFQCKGYEEQRVIRLHISFEHFEPKSPGDTGPRRYSYNKSDTLLHIAASTGRLDIYKKLLKFSHERNPRAEDGRTPLHHACKNGHLNIVEFLLPNLMDKSPRTLLGTTPLHWAAYYGQVDVARYLISFINDTDSRTKKGETPLHFATKTENFEVLKVLLEFSKSKNPANNAGVTLLHLGAKQGNLAIFEYVWNLTLEKNPGNDSGFTPLHVACERGHLDIVKFLVSRLKDMAPKDIRERIPLHYAAKGGYEKIVKLLLQCWNADSYIKSNSQDQGHRNSLAQNPNPSDEQDMSPMCYAAFKGHFPIIHFMSEFFLKNYPIENVIKYFQRACIHAASNSSPKIVEYLSDYIQERCPWKRTLMHYACQNGHRRLLKTLLNIYGMKDVERKDSFGKTPIHYAQTEGHFSTARILELRLIESNCAAKRFKSQ